MSHEHPGFKAVRAQIANRVNPHTGKKYGAGAAGRILAFKSSHASPAAKKANPRLKKV